MFPEPDAGNGFLEGHVGHVLRSYHALTGNHLTESAALAYGAPFVLLSHDTAEDPLLTYGNLAAQELFAMDWERLVGTPSRETAEAPERAEREGLLRRVAEKGYIDDYSGIRIAADGRRFVIRNATVWNVTDAQGNRIGQAATFSEWEPLDG